MLSDQEIEAAKERTAYTDEPLHEHNDCVRIAYEWLDAQQTIGSRSRRNFAVKHLIEKWGGRYVSRGDVEVAATMHPRISGTYPMFNLSARLTLPNDRRLEAIGEALTQDYRSRLEAETYAQKEA